MITGTVVAHKVLADGIESGNNISVQLPSIDIQTAEIKGAGVAGSIDMPMTGQIAPMSVVISTRGNSKGQGAFIKPGAKSLELRFVTDQISSTGEIVPAGSRIYMIVHHKKYEPGKIENASTMDGSLEYEVTRYREVIDGEETILVDKLAYIYKIDGVDYLEKVRAAL